MIAPHSAQHMIFVPKSISKHQESILHLLDMHCGEATGVITANKGQIMVKCSHKTIHLSCAGYLVLVEHSLCPEHMTDWQGDTIHIKPTAETIIALAQIRVNIGQAFLSIHLLTYD